MRKVTPNCKLRAPKCVGPLLSNPTESLCECGGETGKNVTADYTNVNFQIQSRSAQFFFERNGGQPALFFAGLIWNENLGLNILPYELICLYGNGFFLKHFKAHSWQWYVYCSALAHFWGFRFNRHTLTEHIIWCD